MKHTTFNVCVQFILYCTKLESWLQVMWTQNLLYSKIKTATLKTHQKFRKEWLIMVNWLIILPSWSTNWRHDWLSLTTTKTLANDSWFRNQSISLVYRVSTDSSQTLISHFSVDSTWIVYHQLGLNLITV